MGEITPFTGHPDYRLRVMPDETFGVDLQVPPSHSHVTLKPLHGSMSS